MHVRLDAVYHRGVGDGGASRIGGEAESVSAVAVRNIPDRLCS